MKDRLDTFLDLFETRMKEAWLEAPTRMDADDILHKVAKAVRLARFDLKEEEELVERIN
jgi:hypothetical protein